MGYFNSAKLNPATCEYVLWIDCMGTKVAMSRSIDVSANFVGKFQSTLVECNADSIVKIYPIMDGAYVTSPSQKDITSFIAKFLNSMTSDFLREARIQHQFIVRGSLAYGFIQHGENIPIEAFCSSNSTQDRKNAIQKHKESLIFGLPVIQAFSSENSAPPFGIFIHESSRTFAMEGKPISAIWYNWFKNSSIRYPHERGRQLRLKGKQYFEYYESHAYEFFYPPEKIKQHKEMFIEFIESYFPTNTNEKDSV